MGIEIERKFLITRDFPKGEKQYTIKQGYINPELCTIKILRNSGLMVFIDKKGNIVFQQKIGFDSISILKNIENIDGGTLVLNDHNVARIRMRDNEGFLTIKGRYTPRGVPEYEYKIPVQKAAYLLGKFAKVYIDKVRHIIPFGGKVWEVDEFISPIKLTLAEVELSDIKEDLEIPSWVGKEVTGDRTYFNSEIIKLGEQSTSRV